MVRATKVFALWILLAVSWSAGALGAPRDRAAQEKIDEAIFTHFLNTDFDTAEGLLLGTLRACEDKCSPELKGRAWMYVGIIRGVGRKDMSGAEEAFQKALELDPNTQLDDQVANDEVKTLWASLSGGAPPPPAGATEDFLCGLDAFKVQTRRPIPLSCTSAVELANAKLFYQGAGGQWGQIGMNRIDGDWLATIPCSATGSEGALNWYVEGYDEAGDLVSAGGSRGAPNAIEIAEETDEEPPAYPGEEPPARCGAGAATTGGGQCGGWSEPCGAGDCCDTGLSCREGICEPVQCVDNSECDSNAKCIENKCVTESKGGGKKNWISLAFAMDFASVKADGGACTPEARDSDFSCFLPDGSTYFGNPSPAAPGDIAGAFTLGTLRVLLGYERLFGPVGAQVRLGFAFNGGQTPAGGSAFLPIHAELRGKYWFRGEKGFDKGGFLPFVQIGFGVAQVDATVNTDIIDCGVYNTDDRLVFVEGDVQIPVNPECITATDQDAAQRPGLTPEGDPAVGGRVIKNVEATKRLGQTFFTAGLGAMYAIGQRHGPTLNLNFLYMFPSSGVVLQPNIGYAVGF